MSWPHGVPPERAQRLADTDAILLLERSPPAFWRAFQRRMLARLLSHARMASPWWQERLRDVPDDLSPDELHRLPVLRRDALRDSIERCGALALDAREGGVRPHHTSGSTGMPMRFFMSERAGQITQAHQWADHARHRRDARLPGASLVGRVPHHPGQDHIVVPANPESGTGPLYARHSFDGTMAGHARWLARIDPYWLHVASSTWDGVLDEYEAGTPPPRRLREVLQVSESVTPEMRERTRRLVGASIRDRYSCEELGPIALQCPVHEDRLHVCVANTIVEVVDDGGAPCPEGVAGSVLVTGLHQLASPMVRYELGDVAALHPQCRCGERVPSLSGLLGRKRFLLRLPDGQRIQFRVVGAHWTQVAPVRQHRLVQVSADEIVAELVLDRPLLAAEREALAAMLRERIHPKLRYRIEQVNAIAWAPGGKRQEMVCLI